MKIVKNILIIFICLFLLSLCSTPGRDQLYKINTGNDPNISPVETIEVKAILQDGHSSSITNVAFNSTGTLLISHGNDGIIKLFDIQSKRLVDNISLGMYVKEAESHPNLNII